MKEIWVLVNARAGRRHGRENGELIQRAFRQSGRKTRMAVTDSVRQAQVFLKEAACARPDLLVCCGGDGTLSMAVDVLGKEGASLTLGYVPMGTTNDFAASLGISRDPVQAVEQILQGSPTPLDLGELGDRRFLYVASFGVFTQSSYRTSPMAKATLGHLAYLLEGTRELTELHPCSAEVEADGCTYAGDFLFGAVSSATSLGGVLKLDPDKVRLDDGLLELTLVRMPKNPVEWGQALHLLQRGGDGNLVIQQPVRRAVFSCEEEFPWSLDGEYVPGAKRAEIQVLPHAVELML